MHITNYYEKKEVGNEMILIPDSNSELKEALILNKTAKKIYIFLEQGYSTENIISALINEYDVNRTLLADDIEKQINIFIQKKVFVN